MVTGSPLECCRASVVGRPVAGGREQRADRLTFESQFCFFGRFFTQKNRQKLEWSRGQNVLFDFHISHRTLAFSPSWFLRQQKSRWHKTCQISLGTGGAAKTEEFLKKFLRGGKAHFQSKTLPKALRTQVLTALTSSFGGKGLVSLVQ